GGMHLALHADQAVRPDERKGVVMRAAEKLAEAVAHDNAVPARRLVHRLEDPAVERFGVAGDLRRAVMAGRRQFGKDDELAARLRRLADESPMQGEVAVPVPVPYGKLRGRDPEWRHHCLHTRRPGRRTLYQSPLRWAKIGERRDAHAS